MGNFISHMSISLDGFVAGPDQSTDNPLGRGGMQLPEWMFGLEEPAPGAELDPDTAATVEINSSGAYIMGRNMFGPIRGPWEGEWNGWWGDNPPYHAPVFVLTHHERAAQAMDGGTTFHFVTDGIESALRQARAVAGDRDVQVCGGASTVRQYLAAGLLDELNLHLTPALLGSGERLLEGLDGVRLEQVRSQAGAKATHLRYRVVR